MDKIDFQPIGKANSKSPEKIDFESIDFEPIEQEAPGFFSWESLLNGLKQAPGDIAAAPLDLLSGIASGTRDLGNLIPTLLGFAQPIPETQDLRSMTGFGEANPVTKGIGSYLPTAIGSQAAAPAQAIKTLAPLLAKLGTEGAVYGAASNPENPIQQGLMDAAINVAIPGGAAAGKGIIKAIYERYGLPGFAEKILDYVRSTKDLKNSDAVARAENNYQKYSDKEKMAWDELSAMLKVADKKTPSDDYFEAVAVPGKSSQDDILNSTIDMLGLPSIKNNQTALGREAELLSLPRKPLSTEVSKNGKELRVNSKEIQPDNSYDFYDPAVIADMARNSKNPEFDYDAVRRFVSEEATPLDPEFYTTALKNKLSKLKKEASEQPVLEGFNQKSAKQINNYLRSQYGTFSDAINHNRALNKEYGSTLRPASGQPKTRDELKTTSYAIENLQKMLNQNIEKYGMQETLGKSLETARQSTRDINDIFRQVPDAGGNPKASLFEQHQKTDNLFADPTNFVSNYVPKTKGDGTQSMQQFTKVIGDESVAKNYMKREVFNDVLKDGVADPMKFIREYNNLSGRQKDYLFTPQERERINLVNKLVEKYPAKTPKVNFPLWHFGLAGVGGEVVGRVLGLPPAVGALAGVGATIGGEHALYGALSKTGLNEKILKMLINDKGLNASNSSLVNSVAPRSAVSQTPLTGANQ